MGTQVFCVVVDPMAAAAAEMEANTAAAEPSVQDWLETIGPALETVRATVACSLEARSSGSPSDAVRLVAVSKTKPAAALVAAHQAGQRIFGENYVQELCDKAADPSLAQLEGLEYHFIGTLQSNKAATLVKSVPQLAVIETVVSAKLANKLNNAVEAAIKEGTRREGALKVMIQVNSSGEPQKGGVENVDEAIALAQAITSGCPNLTLTGLMTIGNADYTAGPDNFSCLNTCRAAVAAALEVDESSLELSMGMSGDYQMAIAHGSTNVRVGSTIFGRRAYAASKPNA